MRLAVCQLVSSFPTRELAYIRSELEVRYTSFNVLVVGVVEMTVDDLLGEGEGSV
jgi:hypothetical protein